MIVILALLMILVLEMTNKYTHNITLMSRCEGQLLGGKSGKKFGQGPPTGQCSKKNIFLRCSLNSIDCKYYGISGGRCNISICCIIGTRDSQSRSNNFNEQQQILPAGGFLAIRVEFCLNGFLCCANPFSTTVLCSTICLSIHVFAL